VFTFIQNRCSASPEYALSPILERIGLNPDAWVMSVNHYNKNYFSVLGAIYRIKAHAQTQKKAGIEVNAHYCVVIFLLWHS
jgi:hypothetical protein